MPAVPFLIQRTSPSESRQAEIVTRPSVITHAQHRYVRHTDGASRATTAAGRRPPDRATAGEERAFTVTDGAAFHRRHAAPRPVVATRSSRSATAAGGS